MLLTPFSTGEGNVDCFYYDGEMKNCDQKILKKFDMSKFEPIKWNNIKEDDLPF